MLRKLNDISLQHKQGKYTKVTFRKKNEKKGKFNNITI